MTSIHTAKFSKEYSSIATAEKRGKFLTARKYWGTFTDAEMVEWWQHYCTGKGKGNIMGTYPEMTYIDYVIHSYEQTIFEIAHDI